MERDFRCRCTLSGVTTFTGWIALLLAIIAFSAAEGASIHNSTNSTATNTSSTTPSPPPAHLRNFNFDYGNRFKYARDNDFSDQDQIDQQQQQRPNQKEKRKRRRRPLTGNATDSSSSSLIPVAVLPKFDVPGTFVVDNGAGRGASGCGTATTVAPTTTVSPIVKDVFAEEALLIKGGFVAKAIAVAIGIGIIVIKIIIAAIAIWWYYGGDKKGGGDEGYGWGSPAPVYGPPKPVYGAPQPTYGAPVSGYGRQLYESLNFSRLSENVLGALDFFEKYYYSNGIDNDEGEAGARTKIKERKIL